ncbi:MAG: hypothetical protein PW734_09600 [Verrucomicrobium sp.]|nr:hypothetical protein [Verrucomicrobium sp.]
MSSLSPVTPTGLLTSAKYDSLSKAQQLAADIAQKQIDTKTSLISSLDGSGGQGLLNSIGVSGSDQTASSVSANAILSGLADQDSDALPTSIFQLNLLDSLTRAQAGANNSATKTSDKGVDAVVAASLQTYSHDLTSPVEKGNSINVAA